MVFGHLINWHVFSFFLTSFHFSGANLVGSYFISDSSKVREEWIIKMNIVLENVEV